MGLFSRPPPGAPGSGVGIFPRGQRDPSLIGHDGEPEVTRAVTVPEGTAREIGAAITGAVRESLAKQGLGPTTLDGLADRIARLELTITRDLPALRTAIDEQHNEIWRLKTGGGTSAKAADEVAEIRKIMKIPAGVSTVDYIAAKMRWVDSRDPLHGYRATDAEFAAAGEPPTVNAAQEKPTRRRSRITKMLTGGES